MVSQKSALFGMVGALVLAGGVINAATANVKKPDLVHYHKDSGVGLGAWGGKLIHSYGYKDKKLENGNWQVTGQAKSDLVAHSQFIAIYRAAEIGLSEKKAYVKIVRVNGKSLGALMGGATIAGGSTVTFSGPDISYGTRYVVEFELSDTPDSAANCQADVLRPGCKTFEVAKAMQEIRPYLQIQDGK